MISLLKNGLLPVGVVEKFFMPPPKKLLLKPDFIILEMCVQVDTSWNPDVAKEIKKLEFERRIELMTKLIIDKAKNDIKAKGNKKRHKQY